LEYCSAETLANLLMAAEIERADYACAPELSAEEHEDLNRKCDVIRAALSAKAR
jgi:hypothetical protein